MASVFKMKRGRGPYSNLFAILTFSFVYFQLAVSSCLFSLLYYLIHATLICVLNFLVSLVWCLIHAKSPRKKQRVL